MTVVVTGACDGCRYTDCVTVCPVSCFRGDDRMLYIEPTECIECQACIPVCPAQAIFDEDDLPPELKVWTSINAERASALPVVSEKQTPLKTDC